MPREGRLRRAARLTRSGQRDPLWETVVFLQETVKKLGRQLRRGEKTLEEANLEIQELNEQVEEQFRIFSARALHIRNRELELQVTNLRNRIRQLEDLLSESFFSAPPPFERAYSFLD
jgi:predicted  nucleic acid-binding Zn-ribbon protein